jgi:hypothetical protein
VTKSDYVHAVIRRSIQNTTKLYFRFAQQREVRVMVGSSPTPWRRLPVPERRLFETRLLGTSWCGKSRLMSLVIETSIQ